MYNQHLFRLIPVIALIFLTTACGGSGSTDPTAPPEDPEKKLITISQKMADPDEPLSTVASYTYDEDSGLLKSFSKTGSELRLDYDDKGRIIREDIIPQDPNMTTFSSTREYDESGRITRFDGPKEAVEIKYDAKDRIIKVTHMDGDTPMSIDTWTYDAGKLVEISVADAHDPNSPVMTMAYTYTKTGEFYQAVIGFHSFTYQWESDTDLKVTHSTNGTESVENLSFSDTPVAWETLGDLDKGIVFMPRYYTDLRHLISGSQRMDPFGIRRGLYSQVENDEGYMEFDFDAEGYPVESRQYKNGPEGHPDVLVATMVYEWK
ncbi:hypothetical protein [Desulfoluna sp.]|uniref:hypothetical protein n=1 Tax=Desulfoluna sp. TaxID=2045199 RepID=UPI00262DED4C|nr:hypothetical protein [Desulfoluna sp.]